MTGLKRFSPKAILILSIVTLNIVAGNPNQCLAGGQRPAGDESEAKKAYYQGEYINAVIEYADLINNQSGEVDELVKDMAVVLIEDHRFEEAIKLMLKHNISDPLLAEAFLAAGDEQRALKEFAKELAKPGQHYRERLLMGWIASRQKQHHRSITLLWKALKENPKLGTAHLLLGRAFKALAEQSVTERRYFIKRAKEEFKQARKADASLWQVYRELAYMAEEETSWKEAKRQWGRVKNVIGSSDEVKEAMKRVAANIPAPTATVSPVPTAVVRKLEPVEIKDITIKPLGQKDDPVVKVGLSRAGRRLGFGCVGYWRALDSKGRHVWKGLPGKGYRIERRQSGKWYLMNWDGKPLKQLKRPVTIKPLNPEKPLVLFNRYHNNGYFWSGSRRDNRYYRGQLKIKFSKETMKIVNHVLLEDYLLSVVPGEMPALWPAEALKAQAVVARTDTIRRLGTHSKDGYDVCTTAHCAVYQGIAVEHPLSHEAVASTQGEVLMQDGHLSPAFYSHACGGLTQSHREAWWKKKPDYDHPQGIIDTGSNTRAAMTLPLAPNRFYQWLSEPAPVFCSDTRYSGKHSFRWLKIIEYAELSELIDRKYEIGSLKKITVKERSATGYVRHIELVGEDGVKNVYRDYIRSALGGLRSNLFQILPIKISRKQEVADAWVIWGGGWGHGVGLCQAGAGAMGKRGYSYEEILKHYFPEGEIQPWQK